MVVPNTSLIPKRNVGWYTRVHSVMLVPVLDAELRCAGICTVFVIRLANHHLILIKLMIRLICPKMYYLELFILLSTIYFHRPSLFGFFLNKYR